MGGFTAEKGPAIGASVALAQVPGSSAVLDNDASGISVGDLGSHIAVARTVEDERAVAHANVVTTSVAANIDGGAGRRQQGQRVGTQAQVGGVSIVDGQGARVDGDGR